MQHVDGSSWEVVYYSQLLGASDQPSPLDINRSATDQQYCRVRNMEIKVTTPLTPTEETPGRSHTLEGAATVYPHVKPNVGDMFIADVGDGRAGLFAVTQVRRMTHLMETYSEIEYGLVDLIDSRPDMRANLDAKTKKKMVWYDEFLKFGENPQILESFYDDIMSLNSAYQDLSHFYMRDFFSSRLSTLLVPGQKGPTYDPYLTKELVQWLVDDIPELRRVKMPSITANIYHNNYTLWAALSVMKQSYLSNSVQQARLMDTKAFRGVPDVSGIYYTGIQYVVCPSDAPDNVDSEYDIESYCCCNSGMGKGFDFTKGGTLLQATGLKWKDLLRYIPSGNLDGFTDTPKDSQKLENLPDIVPVTFDEYYVLSEPMYRGGKLNSKLEVLVKQALNQEPIDTVTLVDLVRGASNWPNLERYYYHPILFALIKVVVRRNA